MSAFNYSNTANAQRKRILDFLRIFPLDTLTARDVLDIIHPAARVMELRKSGVGIKTIKIDRPSDCGKIHRVARYVLEAGTVAPAPADETTGIDKQETDKPQNSMGGAI